MRSASVLVCLTVVGGMACGSDSGSPAANKTDASVLDDGAFPLAEDAAPIGVDTGAALDTAIARDVAADNAADAPTVNGCPVPPATHPSGTPLWDALIGFKSPVAWYSTDSAAYVAENVIFYQTSDGGWPKNIDMSYRFGVDPTGIKSDGKAMFDNEATSSQIRYMAYMVGAFPGCQRYLESFNAGMKFVFDAQYPSSGGWPQVYPIEPTDYSRHITYNDSAMTRVLALLNDIVTKNPVFAFVPAAMVDKASASLNKGIDCVLRTQIVAEGKKTGWCQQHDATTLLPAPARAYELESESGSEGPGLLAFLMTLDLDRPGLPKADIINAIESAVLFYDQVKIMGLAYVSGATDAGPADKWVVPSPTAGPIWARFYEITPPFAPFFVGRSGVKVATLAEVEYERRSGYSYYVTTARTVLGGTYPSWAAKWTPGRQVLLSGKMDGGIVDAGQTAER